MRQLKITGLSLGAAAALLLSACNDGLEFTDGTGTISPLVSYDPTVITARTNGARAAEISDIEASDLNLTLTAEDGTVSYDGPIGDFPTDKGFNIGKYTLTATYGDPEDEGFEKPAVYGQAELSVLEGKQTAVELTATPSKAMVSFAFDKTLTDYMTTCAARVHSAGGATLDYASTETRPLYIKPGQATVSVSFTKPNGKEGTLQVNTIDAQAQHHYKVTLTLGGDGAGSESITVKYDDLLEDEEVIVDISDQMLSTPAPEVTAAGFTDGQQFTLIEGDPFNESLRFDISARGGIASAVLTTRGASFLAAGWPAEIDLTKASAEQQKAMKELGFKDLGIMRNPGTIAAFDLTAVAGHIPAGGTDGEPVEFSLTVTDGEGRQSQPLGMKIKVEELVLLLNATDVLYDGGSTVDLNLTYNGTAPVAQAVKIQYINDRGLPADATIASATPKSRAANEYIVRINVAADARKPLMFKASCASITTETITVESAPTLTATANDVFATSAWVSLSHPTYSCASKTIKLFASTNGTDFAEVSGTQSGAEFHATGLTPNTAYTLRATVDGVRSTTFAITTEAATQITNGNLDSTDENTGWRTEEVKNLGAKTTKHIPPTPWATNNTQTTKDWLNSGSSWSGVSAVQTTNDTKAGAAAALIRTVGGNQTTATIWSKPSSFAAGVMTLGDDNSGTAITSRPSALTFYYKYVPYTSADQGQAEVTVLDASGNVLATATKSFGATSAYTQASLPLTYNRGAAKAAKIKVKFISTNQNVNSSSVNGKGTDYSYGAAFYVDEIELAY